MELSPISYYTQRIASFIRGLRHIHGHGIHSPFVFDLITNVIEPTCTFYTLKDIALLRKRIEQQKDSAELLKQENLCEKDGEFIFRITNKYKPKKIVVIGEVTGLASLYASSYASSLNVSSLCSADKELEQIKWTHSQLRKNEIALLQGDYSDSINKLSGKGEEVDFIFFNLHDEQNRVDSLFTACVRLMHEKSVCIINGITMNHRMYNEWKKMTAHPDIVIAMELNRVGILFLDKKMHKQTYTLYY